METDKLNLSSHPDIDRVINTNQGKAFFTLEPIMFSADVYKLNSLGLK